MQKKIKSVIQSSIQVKTDILNNEDLLAKIQAVSELTIATFKKDKKVLFCGNGGSAADAQHLSTELSGRFYIDREPLFAEALHVNTSYLTAIANDYDFTETYARVIRGFGRADDLLIALSTSGNSKNIIRAIDDAKKIGMKVVGLTGEDGGDMNGRCDFLLKMPSKDTPRIQEGHMLVGHLICELVEAAIFGA